jgi:murein DD-endopeptidase MepM/ murein hydrolase activator NlpD
VPGDTVTAGDPLGQIGLSGKTTHPHLHLSVYHNGALVDPFRPNAMASCGEEQEMLWAEPPAYDPASLITAGFTDAIPSLPQVTTGKARRQTLRPDQPIVLYGHAGHAEHGDVLTLSATGPDGEVFQRKILLKHPQVSQMQAFGRKAPAEGWEPGEYLGRAQLTRGGRVIAHRFAHVMIE